MILDSVLQPYQIALIALGAALLFYVILLVLILLKAARSRALLSHQLEALIVILLEQEKAIGAITAALSERGNADGGLRKEYENLRNICLNELNEETYRLGNRAEETIEGKILFLAQSSAAMEEDGIRENLEQLRGLQKSHRHMIVVYNGELRNYTYWTRILIARPICYLLGFRKKSRLD